MRRSTTRHLRALAVCLAGVALAIPAAGNGRSHSQDPPRPCRCKDVTWKISDAWLGKRVDPGTGLVLPFLRVDLDTTIECGEGMVPRCRGRVHVWQPRYGTIEPVGPGAVGKGGMTIACSGTACARKSTTPAPFRLVGNTPITTGGVEDFKLKLLITAGCDDVLAGADGPLFGMGVRRLVTILEHTRVVTISIKDGRLDKDGSDLKGKPLLGKRR